MTNQVDLSVEFVDVRGKNIQVLKGGEGETLLYLHSAGGETFPLPFHEALAQHFSLIAPAHPGFDQSTGIDKINDIEDLTFYYLEFLDKMNLDKVNVVGTSLGGWLAMELAVRWPERFKKIALVDAVGIWLNDSPMAEMFGLEPAELRELCFYDPKSDVAQALIQDEPPEEMLFLILKGLETTARLAWNPYLHNPKLHNRLYRINVPTLIIWGEHDKLVPLAYGQALNKAISGSKLEVIKECGHMPIFEKTSEFVELVVNFMK
jgi:pimeloyl-ACP methyl ester carboxylesterase